MSSLLFASPIDLLRLYLIDRLGSVVLHDLRNAVQAILGHSALLHVQQSAMVPSTDIAQKLQQSAERCGRSTMDLNAVLSLPSQRNNSTRLNSLLRDNTLFFQNILKDRRTLRVEAQPSVDSVRVQQQPLMQLLLLWLVRAREFLPPGGVLLLQSDDPRDLLALRNIAPNSGAERWVAIHLEDDGPVLSEERKAQIVTPSATPPSDPEHYWFWLLGSLLQHHGAVVTVQELGVGTRISVLWPQHTPTVAPSLPRPAMS